jgi:DNA phosphorothioation-dependent restriction protein DptG
MYIKQEIIRSSHQSDVFYIQSSETIKRRFMTYEEFKTIAESDAYRLKDSMNNNITDYFWSTVSNNMPLHVPNIDESLFAKRENVFNMTSLPSLLKYYPKSISGT